MLKTLKLWITNVCLTIGAAIAFVLGMALWLFVIMPICLLLAGLALHLILTVLGGGVPPFSWASE